MSWLDQLLVAALDNALGAALLAGLVFLITRWGRNPLVAHALWLLVLVKLVTPPVVPLHWGMSSASLLHWRSGADEIAPLPPPSVSDSEPRVVSNETTAQPLAEEVSAAPIALPVEQAAAHVAAPTEPLAIVSPFTHPSAVVEAPVGASAAEALAATPSAASAPSSPPENVRDASPWRWQPWLAAAWALGSVAYFAIASLRIARFHRALSMLPTADERVKRLALDVGKKLGYRGQLAVRVSSGHAPPLLWAVGRPTVLLPQPLVAALDDDELVGILAHEIAHLVRRDPWVRWFELLVVGLYWWHPVAWYARHALRDAEELACDALVIDRLGSGPEAYVRGLLHALDLANGPIGPSLASGLGRKSSLQRRVEAMLVHRYAQRMSWSAGIAVGLVALAFVPLSMRASSAEEPPPRPAASSTEEKSSEPAKDDAPANTADAPKAGETQTLNPRLGPGDWVDPQVREYLRNYMLGPDWGKTSVLIKGRVVDERGAPVADADVAAQTQLFDTIAVTRSDAQGAFEVRIAAGGYPEHPALIASLGRPPKLGLYQIPAEAADRPAQPYTVVLEQPRDITVKVSDAQGQPIEGAETIVIFGDRLSKRTTTDRQGVGALQIPRSAPVAFIMARKDGLGTAYRAFEPGALADRQVETLTLAGARTVRARALDGRTGRPLAGVMASCRVVHNRENGGQEVLPDLAETWKITRTDGIAEFADVAKEQSVSMNVRSLDSQLHSRSPYDNSNTFFAHFHFDPQRTGNEATFEFWPQVTISGQVRYPDGRAATKMPVLFSDHGQAMTDDTGHFELTVFSNDYYLLVAGDKQWVSPAKAFVVGHESPPPLELVLAPAIRVFGTDPDYRRLRLQQLPEIAYAGLPRKDLLPLRLTERLPGPVIERTAETAAEGRFEFFVGPGKYALFGPRDERLDYFPAFTLTDQREFEVGLRDRPNSARLQGRVVRRDDPQAGVANATIELETQGRGGPPVRSNPAGEFSASVADDDFPIVVRAPGGLLGIIERTKGSNNIAIPVGSPAKVTGRLVSTSGLPLHGTVNYSIARETRGNWSQNTIARDSAEIDDRGFFTLEVVPGWTYFLRAQAESPEKETLPDGTPLIRSVGRPIWLGTARSEAGENVDLGEFVVDGNVVTEKPSFKTGASSTDSQSTQPTPIVAPPAAKPLLNQTVDPRVRAYLEQRWLTGEPDRKAATVRGKVVDAAGTPVADAEVTAEDATTYGTIAKTRSAANGEFELEVRAYAHGKLPALLARDKDRKLIGMARPTNGEPATITLAPAREVPIKVVDGEDKPVAGAVVAAFFANEFATSALTDAAGDATLAVLKDERLELSFARKDGLGFDYVLYSPDGRLGDQPLPEPGAPPLVLKLDGARSVSVKVINGLTREPVAGALVSPYMISRTDRRTMIMMHPDYAPEWKLTGDDGVARFDSIAKTAGVTFVKADLRGELHSRRRDWWSYPDRGGNEMVIELWPKVKLTGQVRFADGRPAGRLPVIIDGGAAPAIKTQTDDQGRFSQAVEPYDYYMVVAGDMQWATPSRAIVVGHQPPPTIEMTVQPAIRVFGSGSNVRELKLVQRPDVAYDELPRDQLLPLRETELHGPRPRIVRTAQADSEGNFEFFVGPGKYRLEAPEGVQLEYTPTFALEDQKTHQVILQRQELTFPQRKFRVEEQDKPGVLVPNAKVTVAQRGLPSEEPSVESTEPSGQGTFFDTGKDLVFRAFSDDESLVGAADWNSGEGDAVIRVGPAGSIRGRIVDPRGAKVVGTISYSTDFNGAEELRRAAMINRQFVKLDGEGRFTLDKLVPGVTYSLQAAITYPFPGAPPNNSIYQRGWRRSQWLGPVKPKSGETVDLGDIVLEP